MNHVAAQPLPDAPYTRFADSPIWAMQRDFYQHHGIDAWASAQIPHYVTSNPSMAAAYAAIALGYWRDARRQYPGAPFYIIELGSGSGEFAFHFLTGFVATFERLREPGERLVYVMTDCATNIVDHWRHDTAGKLQPFVARGYLDFAVFDAESDVQLHLLERDIRLCAGSLEQPPVIIANYVFSALRQDVFFLEKDRVHAAWVQLAPGAAGSPWELTYQKRCIEQPLYAQASWNALIGSQQRSAPPGTRVVPVAALTVIERLRRLHGGELLLMCADRNGKVRLPTPDIAHHGSFSVPVDVDILSALLCEDGATTWRSPPDAHLFILAACVQGRQPERQVMDRREVACAAQATLQTFNPNHFYRIKQALENDAEYLAPAEMLAYLRLSRWDTAIFRLIFPHAQGNLATLPQPAQDDWCVAVLEIWAHHFPLGAQAGVAFDLGIVAAELNRWPIAISLFKHALASTAAADDAGQTCYNLAIAHWQTANHIDAARYLQMACARAGAAEMTRIEKQQRRLASWMHWCEQWPDPDASLAAPTPVFATLLGKHHARALYRHQRDPALCALAGVTQLESVQAAREWIGAALAGNHVPLAIMHQENGLIGVANLAFVDTALDADGSHSARFYYWIGPGFQGRGFGTLALQLLQGFATRIGVVHLFSTVHTDNHASQAVLSRLGARRLPFAASEQPPDFSLYTLDTTSRNSVLLAAFTQLRQELDDSGDVVPAVMTEE